MLSIGLVASASAAATYFLGNALGCQADYYLHPGGHSGRWIGSGAAALGLRGGLDAAGEWAFRLLLDGRDPHGERLVEPVLRADPRSLLPAIAVGEGGSLCRGGHRRARAVSSR